MFRKNIKNDSEFFSLGYGLDDGQYKIPDNFGDTKSIRGITLPSGWHIKKDGDSSVVVSYIVGAKLFGKKIK